MQLSFWRTRAGSRRTKRTPPPPSSTSPSSPRRRLRGVRARSSSLEACLTSMHRRCGARQARRTAHIKHLLSLKVDGEESSDVLTPTYTSTSSPFSQLLQERHKMQLLPERRKMQAWNDFVNSSEEDQERILQMRTAALALSSIREESDEEDDRNANRNTSPAPAAPGASGERGQGSGGVQALEDHKANLDDSWENLATPHADRRSVHPSFSAEECFQRVDKNLRSILTRRHLPLGLVSQLEREVVGFFTDCPGSVYVSHLASSFERLLLHAVCQYLGLCCQSFEEGGERRTQVENKNPSFVLPARSLAQFLERS
ncbi:hypothetical protein ACOMHN_025706 [Nucella lapillus]